MSFMHCSSTLLEGFLVQGVIHWNESKQQQDVGFLSVEKVQSRTLKRFPILLIKFPYCSSDLLILLFKIYGCYIPFLPLLKEEKLRGRSGYEHLNEPLHILIEADLPSNIVDLRLRQAQEIIEELLKPVVRECFPSSNSITLCS